jgi:BirA family transcriptional regulator, biotin operon repressor / biotin---[acetyl-CoA-carboxylase] ligase
MPFDTDRFLSLLTTSRIGRPFRFEPSVPSTMDEARTAGRSGAPHGYTVLADEQTAGRGRFGRRWVAPPGSNLTFTVLVRPQLPVLERLSMVAALAVRDGVHATTGIEPAFKWPNDVQIDGRKLAGILIEAELSGDQPSFALVGIGLNVNQDTHAEAEIAQIAVSLRDLLGRDLAREDLLAAVLRSFESWYDRAPDAAVCEAWSSRLVTLGQTISVAFAGQVETGVAESVTDTGALCLRRADGSLVVLPAGEVTTRLPPESAVG